MIPDLALESPWVVLIYPFEHALGRRADRLERLARLGHRWRPWWSRLDGGKLGTQLDDTLFFLPYVRELVFPETRDLPADDVEHQLKSARDTARLSPADLSARLPGGSVLRLTLAPTALAGFRTLTLEGPRFGKRPPQRFPFEVSWIDLALFPQGLGFLMLKLVPGPSEPGGAVTHRWFNDFLFFVRRVHRPKLNWNLATWHSPDPEWPAFESGELVDFLLGGLTAVPGEAAGDFRSFVAGLRAAPGGGPPRYTRTDAGQVYGEVFHAYVFACLHKRPPAEPVGPFDSVAGCALYELATCTDTSMPQYVPHPRALAALMDAHRVSLWNNWEAMALHDSVAFLAIESSEFTQGDFAHNVESDYLHLYLLALFQKLWLSVTFGTMVRHEPSATRNVTEIRRIWDAFMMFQNRYWFAEVTRKPQGVTLYRFYQRGLEVAPLYAEMKEQMGQLQEYYESRTERSIEVRLSVLTVLGIPAGLIVGLYSSKLVEKPVDTRNLLRVFDIEWWKNLLRVFDIEWWKNLLRVFDIEWWKNLQGPFDLQSWITFLAITAATTIAVAVPYWLWPRLYARWRAWRDGAEG